MLHEIPLRGYSAKVYSYVREEYRRDYGEGRRIGSREQYWILLRQSRIGIRGGCSSSTQSLQRKDFLSAVSQCRTCS